MAEITAALVKELREKSGVGMMDCKKALAENNGDIEASIDWLRAGVASKKKSHRSETSSAWLSRHEGRSVLVGVIAGLNGGAAGGGWGRRGAADG